MRGAAVPTGRPVAASQSRTRPVHAPGEDGLAVGAERHGDDRALMPEGLADGLAGGGVPEPRGAVVAAR